MYLRKISPRTTCLPDSVFTAVVRVGYVDFDTDRGGDDHRRITVGLNFRPAESTVFKLDYQRSRTRDRFDNPGEGAAFLFSTATYF